MCKIVHFVQWLDSSVLYIFARLDFFLISVNTLQKHVGANLPNQYSALCCRPVTHAQKWASYSALYRFRRLSNVGIRELKQ